MPVALGASDGGAMLDRSRHLDESSNILESPVKHATLFSSKSFAHNQVRILRCGILAFVAGSFVPNGAWAQGFTITDIGTLGGNESFASGVNNRGEVIGQSFTTTDQSVSHAFVYRKGTLTDLYPLWDSGFGNSGGINASGQIAGWLNTRSGGAVAAIQDKRGIAVLGSLGGFWANAEAINTVGQVAGWSYLPGDLKVHAFLHSNGAMKDIGSAAGDSFASGLNDFGVVVGGFYDYRGPAIQHAFLHRHGVTIEINPFNTSENLSQAVGINNAEQIIGWGETAPGSWHGFVELNGTVTDLGLNAFPNAINQDGQIVGNFCAPAFPSSCVEHPFLYDDGVITDLNSLLPPGSGWELIAAFDINDRGQIVGYGRRNDHFRAFLLSPVANAKRTDASVRSSRAAAGR